MLFDEIAYVYFVRKIYLIYFRTENSQPRAGTGTVPTVSAHFRSLCVCRRPVVVQNRNVARSLTDNSHARSTTNQNRCRSIPTRWRENCLSCCCSASLLLSTTSCSPHNRTTPVYSVRLSPLHISCTRVMQSSLCKNVLHFKNFFTPPPIRESSDVMSRSVCVFVCASGM